ncbi:MAG: bifunctional glutamate N-acetyltransferase/amino-acid acetyltransferase ArgJ [Deltaproteobacteria bacterium]|nr:bifunctional glutamate N-acetyltransferase/amino-acid acetyltransferase ArgJ [Deltaproteobacteria bacterium]
MSERAVRVTGFRWAGVRCGIKTRGADLMLLASDRPANAAGVLTRNVVASAPVQVTRAHLRRGVARAVVANSGCSNVAMGAQGMRDARTMAALAALAIGAAPRDVLVASTGVIGEPLPMAKIASGIAKAAPALANDGIAAAARAIMTTDTVPKIAGATFRVGATRCTVAGIAKGSGMIEPNMATMLSFLATDAAVTTRVLRAIWREVADQTYNRVTVDGETSTSDTAVVLANGASGAANLSSARSSGGAKLAGALLEVATALAKMLARDGEGATKLVTIEVTGAKNDAQAAAAGRRIANSLLVKTALFGGDPNWGRILQTVGAERVALDLAKTEVELCGVPVFARGASSGPAARKAAGKRMRGNEISIAVALGAGKGSARLWTCDLSYDYVKVNADYTT